jgi:hypothetical protein
MFIIFSVTTVLSSGLLTWTRYYKISLLSADHNTSKRIHFIGILGGCLIGFVGGSVVLISKLHHYYLSNPSASTFTLNQYDFDTFLIFERLIFLISIFLNTGLVSYYFTLITFSSTNTEFIVILFLAIISDLFSLIGIVIYLTKTTVKFYPSAILLVNWISVSPIIDIWFHSYATDFFKIGIEKKRENLKSNFSIGKLEANSIIKVMKTSPDTSA